jgi:hypothetical protein
MSCKEQQQDFESASQLNGEQNIDLLDVDSEQDAAQPALQNLSTISLLTFPSPSVTPMHENLLGEGPATGQRATEAHRPKPLWSPDENLQEAGEALFWQHNCVP